MVMMILLKMWLILSLSAAAPLHHNVDKEVTEEDFVAGDNVNGDGMDGLHNHTSHNTNRDAKHAFHGGNIKISGTIHSTGDHARINIGTINSNALDPQESNHKGSVPEFLDGTCYEDDNSRLLDEKHASATNTPDECIRTCRSQGYSYAGVQHKIECFCGNDEPPASRIKESSQCDMKCPGDSSLSCGGGWRMNVYKTENTDATSEADATTSDADATTSEGDATMSTKGTVGTGIGREALPCAFQDNQTASTAETTGNSSQHSPHDLSRAFIWENNVVPYYFTSASDRDKALFRSVMDIVEEKTCFLFQEKTRAEYEDRHSLEIVTGSESCASVCRGYVAKLLQKDKDGKYFERLRLTSVTQVSDREDCKLQCQGFVLHELMHALGVAHTFSRSDRDDYITVNDANVENSEVEFLFEKCENCKTYPEIPYDCDSIMHYGTHISGIEIMKPKDTNTCSLKEEPKFYDGPIGSDLDWKLLNIIGNCSGPLIKRIRAAMKQMGDELQKLPDDNNFSYEEEFEAKITEITKHFQDECGGVDGTCEAKQIKNFFEDLASIFKKIKEMGKVNSGFLETFEEKKQILDAAAEEVLKNLTPRDCLADAINADACNCKGDSGETHCNAKEKCTKIGTCLPTCTSGEINSGDCACKATGEECTIDQGCTEDGACLNVCSSDEKQPSNCLCTNSWKETHLCNEEQFCKDGICLKGEGDPVFCKAVDCSRTGSEEFCPIKCAQRQPEFCKVVDCALPDSQEYCPFKCAPVCPASLEVLQDDCICNSKNGPEPCRRGNACIEDGCLKDMQHSILIILCCLG